MLCFRKDPREEKRHKKYWTEDELQYLRDNAESKTATAIGKVLNRSSTAVYYNAKRIGVKVSGRLTWSPDDDSLLTDLWPHHKASFIGERMGFTENQVMLRAARLKLGISPKSKASLKQFSTITGYDHGRITMAMKKLGISPEIKKAKTGRVMAKYLYPEQREEVIQFLATIPDQEKLLPTKVGSWGTLNHATGKYKAKYCKVCGTTKSVYKAHDTCNACYQRQRKHK